MFRKQLQNVWTYHFLCGKIWITNLIYLMIRRPCTFSTFLVSFGNLYVSTNNLFHLRCWCIDKMFIKPFLFNLCCTCYFFFKFSIICASLFSFLPSFKLAYLFLTKLFQKFVNNNFFKEPTLTFQCFLSYHCFLFHSNLYYSFYLFPLHWSTFYAHKLGFSSVQSLSRVRLFASPWIAAHQASLSITNSRSSLRLTSIESVIPASHLSHPRSSSSPPALTPSQHQSLLQWVNSSHEVAKILEFQL